MLIKIVIISLFLLLSQGSTFAKGWMTGEYQFDSRDFNTLNLTGFSTLPQNFSIWGFVDFEANKASQSRQSDLSTHFIEIDLRSPRWRGLGITTELDSTNGIGNDTGRLGLYYLPKAKWLNDNNMFLFFKGFPIETNGDSKQISLAWNIKFAKILDGRFSMGGFADWNFNSGKKKNTNLVTDTQFRFRLINNLSFLVEYRKNEFITGNEDGTGIGLQYKF